MTFEKFIAGYLLFFVMILMLRYSIVEAGADYSQNPAWVLINFLSILMGSILVIVAICFFVHQHQVELQRAAERQKYEEAMRIADEKSAERSRVYAIEYAKEREIAAERDRQNEIRRQLEQKEQADRVARELVRLKNRTAMQVCEEALSELL